MTNQPPQRERIEVHAAQQSLQTGYSLPRFRFVRISQFRTHLRRRNSPEGVSAHERYRRITMAVNLRLTHAIKDRVVQNFQLSGSELLISFLDGSGVKATVAEW